MIIAEHGLLSNDEVERYSRQLLLPEVGVEGQAKLRAASVLIVGAGGLGSPLAMYLAAAGVGRLGLVDFDTIDASNLHRQLLYGSASVGQPKLDAARERLHDINPSVTIETHAMRLSPENALALIASYEVVADGTDNFATRYLVNDASVLAGKPNVYASIFQFEGQASVFGVANGPCYRCIYPAPPPPGAVPSCAEGGVLGVLPGLLGIVQATEVLKLLLGVGEPLVGRLVMVDALAMRFREFKIRRNPQCPLCGEQPTITSLGNYDVLCGLRAAGNAEAVPEISVHELHARQMRGEVLALVDVRRPAEYAIANLGGKLIPLDDLAGRLSELGEYRDTTFVVYCRSGARSAEAVQLLHRAGFTGAMSLRGGILAWSQEIDQTLPRY